MKKLVIMLCALLVIFACSSKAATATLITFDNITTKMIAPMPIRHGEFLWIGESLLVHNDAKIIPIDSRFPVSSISGKYIDIGTATLILAENSQPFDFNGGYFTSLGAPLYLLGIVDHSVSDWVKVETGNELQFVDVDWEVDGLLMASRGVWCTDDMDIQPTPTPEPATLLLTGVGLATMGYMGRRKKKNEQ